MNIMLYTAVTLTITAILAGSIRADKADSPAARGLDAPADFFPILPWEGIRGEDLESVADCNFTVAGFVQAQDVPACEKLGLKAIIAPRKDFAPWRDKWVNVPDDVVDDSVKRMIEEAGKSNAIIGYFITDEPGTSKFAALSKAVAAVKKYAPGKLAYINLFPGYATIGAPDQSQLEADSYTDYLERFIKVVEPQMLSYDDYMVHYSDDFQDERRAAIYFTDLLEVRRVALEHGLPFWNTVCSNQIRPFTTIPSPANLMLQAYTTLAAGGRGLAWYTYYERGYDYAPIDKSGRRTDTWQYLRVVNGQLKVLGPIMNPLRSTGVFFTGPAPGKGLPLLPGRLVESATSRSSVRGLGDDKPPMMVGEFDSGGGSDYVMVVNLSLEKSANFQLNTRKSYRRKSVISAQDGTLSQFDEENGEWLVPGGGVLIQLSER